jgi:molybdenum cofactor cytidylyltransferase
MKYGPVPVEEAEGAILAHSFRPQQGKPIKKGTKLTAADIERISAAGVGTVLAAVIEAGDTGEDEAAKAIGAAMEGDDIRAEAAATGRVNLYAEKYGLFDADPDKIDRINRIDPGVTLATLARHTEVNPGRLIATVKIIPYAVSQSAVDKALAIAESKPFAIHAYSPRRVGVVATRLPQLKPSVMDKTIRVLERRLASSQSVITGEIRTEHETEAIAAAIGKLLPKNDIVLAFGASAICDIDDVIPAAIRRLGGRIEQFGMPVDPGNLLLIGEIGGKPVIGAPGCARSPAENGFDWVLQRLVAGQGITSAEITGMGVGGLLMEIGTRPQPRESAAAPPRRTAAVILAAGQSRRMGSRNKLVAELDGESLVGRVAKAALESNADPVIVVTGHEAETVKGRLKGLAVRFVHNRDYAEGLSTSLVTGIAAVPNDCDSAVVLLGDMPLITAEMIDRLIEAARGGPPDSIALATFNGKRGNPVMWPRSLFHRLKSISGDVGARHVIGENSERVITVELGEAAGIDIDTPEALEEVGSRV